jgi:Protein of unknown function (DUF2637)
MTGILRKPRRAALVAIAVLVAAASLVSFAESYRGLFLCAHHHGLSGPWAVIWPLQVDGFIAVGELALFVALADRWQRRSRVAAWAVILAGLAVSVAGNVGHVAGHSLASRATAAIPPLAAAASLAVGLGVMKRVVEHHHQVGTAPATPVATVAALGSGQDGTDGLDRGRQPGFAAGTRQPVRHHPGRGGRTGQGGESREQRALTRPRKGGAPRWLRWGARYMPRGESMLDR